jgi:hypothetical protein
MRLKIKDFEIEIPKKAVFEMVGWVLFIVALAIASVYV